MAVSFTAEYLYQGANYIRNDPSPLNQSIECPEFLLALGRGVYSLGTLVVSPVGALYHTSQAAYRTLEQCWVTDTAKVESSKTRVWQHLYAAGDDLLAFGHILLNVALVACVVAAFLFPEAAPGLIAPVVYAVAQAIQNNDIEKLFLPYYFSMYPTTALFMFLSDEKEAGVAFSQQDRYFAHYLYDPMVRMGMATDAPLTSAEILAFQELTKKWSRRRPDFVEIILTIPTFLKEHNRAAPAAVAFIDALLAKRAELNEAQRAAFHAGRDEPEESRNEVIAKFWIERVNAIRATLPPLSTPVPAQPATA